MLLKNDTNFYSSMTSSVRHLASWVQVFDNTAQLATYSKNDALKSWEIQRVGDGSKFFGFGICHRLNVKLRDVERQINISTKNHLKVFICPEGYNLNTSQFGFPIFYVSEVHRDENTNELSITAYDRLYKAADHTLDETGNTKYSQPRFYVDAVIRTLGGINGSSPLNINFPVTLWNKAPSEYSSGGNYSGGETLRAVLDDVAELTQSIYYLNYENRLVFKRIAHEEDVAPDFTISKEGYITLDSSTNRRLARIYHTTALGDDTFVALAESGTTQYIHDNPFWNLREDIDEKLQDALDAMGGATINQFTCSWRGYPALEIADKIALVTKDDDTVIAYLLNDILTYDGGLSEKTEWAYDDSGEGANPVSNDAAALGEKVNNTAATVDKINQRIDLIVQDTYEQFEQTNGKVAELTLELDSIKASVDETITERMEEVEGDITEITQKVAALEITADSITGNIEKVQTTTSELEGEVAELTQKVEAGLTAEDVQIQITESLKNGVSEVTTTTGFTFNEEGLTITKSDSDLSTVIDEDGLTILRDGRTEVLIADNEGVKAENLHATTYLLIGVNSRFEDYDNKKRTGCFWIGD